MFCSMRRQQHHANSLLLYCCHSRHDASRSCTSTSAPEREENLTYIEKRNLANLASAQERKERHHDEGNHYVLNTRERELLSSFIAPSPTTPSFSLLSPSTHAAAKDTKQWVSVSGSALPPLQRKGFEYALQRKNKCFIAQPHDQPEASQTKDDKEVLFDRFFHEFQTAHYLEENSVAGADADEGSNGNESFRQSLHHSVPSLLHQNIFRDYILVNDRPTHRVAVSFSFINFYNQLPSPEEKNAFWLYYYKTYYLPRALAEAARHHAQYVAYIQQEEEKKAEGATQKVEDEAESSPLSSTPDDKQKSGSTHKKGGELPQGKTDKQKKPRNRKKKNKHAQQEEEKVNEVTTCPSELVVPFLLTQEMVDVCSTGGPSGYQHFESTPLTLRRRIEIILNREYLTAKDLTYYGRAKQSQQPFPSLFYFTLTTKAKYYGPSTPHTPSAPTEDETVVVAEEEEEKWKAASAAYMKQFTHSAETDQSLATPITPKKKKRHAKKHEEEEKSNTTDDSSHLTNISYLYLSYYIIPSPLSTFNTTSTPIKRETSVSKQAQPTPTPADALSFFTTQPMAVAPSPCWVPLRLLQSLPFFPIPPPPVVAFSPPLQQSTASGDKAPPADPFVALKREEDDIVSTYYQLLKEVRQGWRRARDARAKAHATQNNNSAKDDASDNGTPSDMLRALTSRILLHRIRERVVEFYQSSILLRAKAPTTTTPSSADPAAASVHREAAYLGTTREEHNVNDYVFANDHANYLTSFWQRKKDITYHLPFLYFFPLNALAFMQAGMRRRAADMQVLRRQQIYQRSRHKRFELRFPTQQKQKGASPPTLVDATGASLFNPRDLQSEATNPNIFYPLYEPQLHHVTRVFQLQSDVHRIRFHAWELAYAIKDRRSVHHDGHSKREENASTSSSDLTSAFTIYADYYALKHGRDHALQKLFRDLTHFRVLRSARDLFSVGGAKGAWANKYRFSGAFAYHNEDYNVHRHLLTNRNTVWFGFNRYVNLADTTLSSFFDSDFAAAHCVPLTEDGEVFFPLMEAVRMRQMRPLRQHTVLTDSNEPSTITTGMTAPTSTDGKSSTSNSSSIFLDKIRELTTNPDDMPAPTPRAHHTKSARTLEKVRTAVVLHQPSDAHLRFQRYSRVEKEIYAKQQQQESRYYFQSPYWVEVREDMEERWGVRPLPHVVRSAPLQAKELAAGISPPPPPVTSMTSYHQNDPRARPICLYGRLFINAEQTTDASVFNAKTCSPQHVVHVVTELGVFPVKNWRERRRLQQLVATALENRRQQATPPTAKSTTGNADAVPSNYFVSRKLVEEAGLRLRPGAIWLQMEEVHLWSWRYLDSRSQQRRDQEGPDEHSTDRGEKESEEAKKDSAKHIVDIVYAGDIMEQDKLLFLLTYEPRILFYSISDLGERATSNHFVRHMAEEPENTYVPFVRPSTSPFAPTLVEKRYGVGAAERWDLEELATARAVLATAAKQEQQPQQESETQHLPFRSLFPSFPVHTASSSSPPPPPPLANATMLSLFHFYNETVSQLTAGPDGFPASLPSATAASTATLGACKDLINAHNRTHVTAEYVQQLEQRALERKRYRYNYFRHSRLNLMARMQMAVLALRMRYDEEEKARDNKRRNHKDTANNNSVPFFNSMEERGTLWVTTDFLLEQQAFLAPKKEETIALEVTLQVHLNDPETDEYTPSTTEEEDIQPKTKNIWRSKRKSPMGKSVTLTVVNTQELTWKGSQAAMADASRFWVSKLY